MNRSVEGTACSTVGSSEGEGSVAMPAATVAPCPVRRVVSLLKDNIDRFEHQKNKAKNGSQNDQKIVDRPDYLLAMLEYTWDLTKQVMGIAVLAENDAKKQARKDAALRKSQDLQLVQNVLLLLSTLEHFNDPVVRSDFLSGSCGAAQLTPEDMYILDKLRSELTSKPVTEEGVPTLTEQTMEAAKHVTSIVQGDAGEAMGTSYPNIKNVISTIHQCGYFDRPRQPTAEEPEEPPVSVKEEPVEEVEVVPPPTPIVPVNQPPPAPQTVPAPAFTMLAPRAPPVTVQQVETHYFAQYNHPQQHPPMPEVIGPQSFIFLQESELDSAEISQQPTPRPASPASIPSQTFTNQSFSIPQHFTPDLIQNPHLPIAEIPQPVHFPPNDVQVPLIPNYTNPAAPPILIPTTHPIPPHMAIPPAPVVPHPHNLPQQRLPSPSFPAMFNAPPTLPGEHPIPQNPSEKPEDKPISPVPQDSNSREWNDRTKENHNSGQLEIDEWKPEETKIDEWNPQTENSTSESTTQTNGQSGDKFRPRGRGRGGSGNFRGRGNYQNGRPGNYFKNEHNGNGRNYNDNFKENRRDRYDGNSENRGRGANGRGPRQNGSGRGAQSRGGSRPPYQRKSGNHFEARNGFDSKQTFTN